VARGSTFMFIHFAAKNNYSLHNVKTEPAKGPVLRSPTQFWNNKKILRSPLPGYDDGRAQDEYFDREVKRMDKEAADREAAAQKSFTSSGDSDNKSSVSPVRRFLRLW
jgi:hypothetical protein